MNEITEEIKKKILLYCKSIVPTLSIEYIEKNNIYQNEFLDYLFASCVNNYILNGTYTMTKEEISICFAIKKSQEKYLELIRQGEIKILGIDKNDNLIVDTNEINLRAEIEREEN